MRLIQGPDGFDLAQGRSSQGKDGSVSCPMCRQPVEEVLAVF